MTPRRPSLRISAGLRRAATALGLAAGLAGGPAAAEEPVVVELFTSQGCSVCPPADALLGELARRGDVLALGLHVDYWDYIGWEDAFADPAYTRRQKSYAHAAGDRMIYTPQMIVDGTERLVGHDRHKISRAIDAELATPTAAVLAAIRDGSQVRVRAQAADWPGGAADVVLVTYAPGRTVSILSGENAGHMLDYVNVVTGMVRIASWDGAAPLDVTAELPGEGAVAVLLQRPGPGEVLAAAKVD